MYVKISPNIDQALLKNRKNGVFELITAKLPSHKMIKVDSSLFTQLSLTWHPTLPEFIFQELNPKTLWYDLYKIDLEKKERYLIDLPPSKNAIPPIRWSPNGKYLAYLLTRKQTELILFDYENRHILFTFSDVNIYSDFQWSEDSTIYYIKNPKVPVLTRVNIYNKEIDEFNLLDEGTIKKISVRPNKILFVGRKKNDQYYQCYEYDIPNRKSVKLTSQNYNVTDCRYSLSKPIFFYNTNENGLDKLYCSDSLINKYLLDISKDGIGYKVDLEYKDEIYVNETSFTSPPKLSKINLKSLEKTDYYKPYNSEQLVVNKPKFHFIKNHKSELELPCFYWPSKDTTRRTSRTIIYVHGGPFLQSTPLWDMRTWIFNQYNFNVLSINYSGSSGYSKEFAEETNFKKQVFDIFTSIKFLNSEYKINNEDIILMGSSYGGKLVLYANEYLKDIGGVVLISSPVDQEIENFERLKDTKLFAFYGKLDPLSVRAKTYFNDQNLLNSNKFEFSLFENEGHYFHKSSSWADLYGSIINHYSREKFSNQAK